MTSTNDSNVTNTNTINNMSTLESDMKQLANNLQALSLNDQPSVATEAAAIITGVPADFKNSWRDYLLVQKLVDTARLPTKNTEADAGFDLYAFDTTVIPAWGKALISTQISVAVPPGTYGRIAPRSGLSVKHDLEVGAGVVDPGYTGEVKVVLRNFSDKDYTVQQGDKIAQLILENYRSCPVKNVKSITEILGFSARGSAGFGSSGK